MSEPYYQDEHVTIYHGDCREVLPQIGPVNLVVTDPPYGISDSANTHTDRPDGRRGPRGGRVNDWHPESSWDTELCTPPLGANVIAWFGHWRKREDVASVYGRVTCELIWAKDTHVGPPCPAAMQDERIWIFGKFKPLRFETTVWQVPIIPTWAHRFHKNEKPVALLQRLVSWLPGEVVLDPFMGSGTTLEASKLVGRKSIGIELEERYCEIAADRCRQKVLPFS